ncbi:MAG TPA: M1 family metallopeptidase [Chryseosolibacter sp.]|nr:M1 family metallopeptidase [Chryseosolibacter sp.]
MRLIKTSFLVLALMISRCGSQIKNETTIMKQDPHSFSRPAEAKVKHLYWKATINFETRVVEAMASWMIENPGKADSILLDTRGITIKNIMLDNKIPAKYSLGNGDVILGEPLAIAITPDTRTVSIEYETSPDAEALQWLTPQQTAGKKFPFLFTQSQAILARSWVPCQDTPGIRFTYEADVTVPKDLLAMMSASNPQQKNSSGQYHFEMKQPISSYLLALAVGDITFKPISERSGVYAEKEIIDKATWEFEDLEKMIAAAEALYGPYQWERYDVLVLPPSFPFGGMENPRLTFATPTILAGDRSLTSLIAHELAHSWSGNLVTNATWNDFWLNEGFTVYFETRIMEKLYGKDYGEMLASLNLQDLHDEIESLRRKGQFADTRLKLELEGRNPDEGVTSIAYNKGYFFLRSLEEKYGREKFDAFLKDYFSDNAFGSMNTEAFKSYIGKYYKNKFNITLEDNTFHKWIEQEGLPEDVPQPASERFQKVDQLLASWKTEKTLDKSVSRNWSSHEWLHFLKNLPGQLSPDQMTALDNFGNFTESGNAEIITAWGVISIRNNYEKMLPKVEEFLIHTGRRKFLSPLYHEFMKTESGRERAREIYRKARPNYHFVATNTFDKLLGN